MNIMSDLAVRGKRVLLRADFNVPINEKGEITDDFRIVQTLPTIQYLLEKGAKLIIMSHLGDPEGKRVERLTMDRVQERLSELLLVSVAKAKDCIGKDIESQSKEMREGEILLLENLRFHGKEEENDEGFAKELAKLGDVYVNDAFGVAHRSHASVVLLPKLLPSGAGKLLKKEIEGLEKLLSNPRHPMIAVIGGRKVESKLPVIDKIAETADAVLLGNLLAREIETKHIMLKHKEKVVLPLDGIPGKGKEFDIGPETQKLFAENMKGAHTIVWSGPLGRYEEAQYAKGSVAVAQAIVEEASFAVAGGGNLLDLLGRYGLREKFDHISTGGSSMLAFLAGQKLPGLEALGYYSTA